MQRGLLTLNTFDRWMIALGLIGAGFSVIFGAFAAHALRDVVEPNLLQTFETGARYQMYHSLGLLVISLLAMQAPQLRMLGVVRMLMLSGVVLFSGSLYCLVLSGQKAWGMVTPFGGVLLVLAWCIACASLFLAPKSLESEEE